MDAIRNGHSGTISSIFVLKQQFVDSKVKCLFFRLVRKYGFLNGLPNLNLTLLFQGQSPGGGGVGGEGELIYFKHV